MAQITTTKGRIKKAKIAKIIHKANNQASIFLILPSKNKPSAIRKVMISPLVKKRSISFILVGDWVMLSTSSTEIDFPGL